MTTVSIVRNDGKLTELQETQSKIAKRLAKRFPTAYIQLSHNIIYSFGNFVPGVVSSSPFQIWISTYQRHFNSAKSFEDCIDILNEYEDDLNRAHGVNNV